MNFPPLSHPAITDLLQEHLTPDVAKHLQTCVDCAATFARMSAVRAALEQDTIVEYWSNPEVLGNSVGIMSPDAIGPLCDKLHEETLESRVAFEGVFLRLYQDKVRAADGHVGIREYVRHPGAVTVVAAILTPTTDILNMLLFAAPMVGLYLISIAVAWMVLGP